MSDASAPRARLARTIPRRPRVAWWLGLVLAGAFALLVTPAITADRWLAPLGLGPVVAGAPAPLTVRVPALYGADAGERRITGGGVLIARGEVATAEDAANAEAVTAAQAGGALPYAVFAGLAFVLAALFTHHLRRSTHGRLVRVQIVSLVGIAGLAAAAKVVLLVTPVSLLVVPVAVFALVPTLVFDRVVGIATGVLAALVVALLAPFDVGVAIVLLVQAAAAGLLVAERPRNRWRAAVTAGVVTTLLTAATYGLVTYLSTGTLPAIGDPARSPWLAAVLGPLLAAVIAAPLVPLYQLLVGEITHAKLIELEDLSHPLLKQIAEKAPGTWQHSLMMANLAEIAANAIGASGRLVRVGAYYHDLGKSLSPKYFIENLEPGETSPHDQLPPEVSCDAIFAHVTDGIVAARKAGLHERIVDFMHMHHGNGVLEYFWSKCREQGNPQGFSIEAFRYPGHPPQSRETAILAICDAVEAASRTLKKPEPAAIDSLVQRIVYGKLHLGQLDECGLSMSDLRRISDSLRETIRHANHGRIEYPWQKAQQDASASAPATTTTAPRLDSLDTPGHHRGGPIMSSRDSGKNAITDEAIAATADLKRGGNLGILDTAPTEAPVEPPPAPPMLIEVEEPPAPPAEEPPRPPPGPPPDLITPATFAEMAPGARKRAATLPPTPLRRAPTMPPMPLGDGRTGGPPRTSDLDSMVTNPPPRRSSGTIPPPAPSRRPAAVAETDLAPAASPFDDPHDAPTRRFPMQTAEVDPDDIEAAIELAPPARRAQTPVGVVKPKKP